MDKLTDLEKVKFYTKCYVEATNRAEIDGEFNRKVQKIYEEMELAMASNDLNAKILSLWKDIRRVSLRHLKNFYK